MINENIQQLELKLVVVSANLVRAITMLQLHEQWLQGMIRVRTNETDPFGVFLKGRFLLELLETRQIIVRLQNLI